MSTRGKRHPDGAQLHPKIVFAVQRAIGGGRCMACAQEQRPAASTDTCLPGHARARSAWGRTTTQSTRQSRSAARTLATTQVPGPGRPGSTTSSARSSPRRCPSGAARRAPGSADAHRSAERKHPFSSRPRPCDSHGKQDPGRSEQDVQPDLTVQLEHVRCYLDPTVH